MSDFTNIIAALAQNPEDAKTNLELAMWYYDQNQTAAAITYFLRAAERAPDTDLAYACLVRTAQCFDHQGHRHVSVRTVLKRAITVRPRRPEAHWYLAKFNEYFNQHADAYVTCVMAQEFCDFASPPLPMDVDYPGSWIFLLERSISAWWWGQNQESRDGFWRLYHEHWDDMPDAYRRNLIDNMRKIKMLDDFWLKEYQRSCDTVSDINQHIPMLWELAQQCDHITEMGVRTGVSTRAWLRSDAVLRSYDIEIHPPVAKLFDIAQYLGKDAVLIKADTRKIGIDPTDLLFIDTAHKYDQLREELTLHADRAGKFLVFHDTTTFGYIDDDQRGPGLMPAITEFLAGNPHWKIYYRTEINNGLVVLKRDDS